MRTRMAVALAAALSLMAGGVAVALPSGPKSAALSDSHVRRPAVNARLAGALGARGEMRGMALNDIQPTGRGLLAEAADFPRMALEGITSVAIYVYLYVDDPNATQVHSGLLTPQDTEITTLATAAKLSGMTMQLQPVLLDTQSSTWRGRYVPSDVNAFFASYDAQVLHYADLATSIGASLFYVGSENDAIANYTAQWTSLIASVRQHFSGALSYMSTGYTPLKVRFWNKLDVVSISPYFSLGVDATPTYDRARAAWSESHTPYVRSLIKKLKMPIIYGEAGYHSQQHTYAQPQAAGPVTALAAPAAQADAYAALLDVMSQEPGVYGVTWWRWASGTTIADTSYSPNGKPAECVIAQHWSTNAVVRQLAAGPQCDLHAFDAGLVSLAGLLNSA
ncbi:MAG: hypothetical protein JWM40_1956 [Frankiales bacterium]|nr:hypothetical protein [Frankiales bacterium]